MALLELDALTVGWPHGPPVLDGLSFRVQPGERVALVGPNGSGKSTLFQTIAGALAPRSGQVLWQGKKIAPGRFQPRIGLVFQHAADQLFCPTLLEDVAFGPRNLNLPEAEVQARTQQALSQCGLTGLEDRPVHRLSGGEKRRACIAGVLAMAPDVLLLDEPSSALDLRNRRRLIALLSGMTQAMLIASHDLELVLELCPRVILIDGGRICADGPARAILGNAALMEAHGQEVPHSLTPHDGTGHWHVRSCP